MLTNQTNRADRRKRVEILSGVITEDVFGSAVQCDASLVQHEIVEFFQLRGCHSDDLSNDQNYLRLRKILDAVIVRNDYRHSIVRTRPRSNSVRQCHWNIDIVMLRSVLGLPPVTNISSCNE